MFTLVIGGAASGKSEYAESLLLGRPGPRYYLATMEPAADGECRARIERHRALRAGKGFATIERAVDLRGLALPARGDVLLEDLGNLAANELYSPAGAGPDGALEAVVEGVAGGVPRAGGGLQRDLCRRAGLRPGHRCLSAAAGGRAPGARGPGGQCLRGGLWAAHLL